MSAELVGRRLLLGGVIGALAAPRAQADTSFTNFRFPATGASAARTMPDRLAEIKNVRDYGAVGDGVHDDTDACQRALDAAFGTDDAPHGNANKNLNKPVYFPSGGYKLNKALTVKRAYGGLIYGDGQRNVYIVGPAGGTAFRTNGASYMTFRNLAFAAGGGAGSIAFDLDWDGTSPDGSALNANTFENVGFSGAEIGIAIGKSGWMGSENVFLNCNFNVCSDVGLVTLNYNALDQTIIGGGASGNGTGYRVLTGSIQLIMNVGLADNTKYDIDIQSNCINAIIGCRSESANFINGASGTFSIVSCSHHGRGMFIDNLNGSCFLSACQSYNGKIKGNHGPLDIRASDFNTLGMAISAVANNGSGGIRITVGSTWNCLTGDEMNIAGVSNASGVWIITVIDGSHVDLQGSTFAGNTVTNGWIWPTATNHLRLFNGPVAESFIRERRENRTGDYAIKRGFSGTQYDNLGATGPITFTLPTMNDDDGILAGTKFGFYVAAAQTLTVQATNSMTIRVAGSVSVVNGTVSSSTVGDYIEIECLDGAVLAPATKWIAKSVVGTWTVKASR